MDTPSSSLTAAVESGSDRLVPSSHADDLELEASEAIASELLDESVAASAG